jgi:opacity protein-like surface antigen
MKRIILAALFLVALAAPALAQDAQPILSKTRLSLGVAADYCGYQNAGDQRLPDFTKSWEFGVVGSYTLVAPKIGQHGPILSLAAGSGYDVDNKWFRHRVGLRLVVFKGGKY